jgi:hypothetical protein
MLHLHPHPNRSVAKTLERQRPLPSRDCVVTPNCLCERPKGAWQSLYFQCIMRLLRSLHSLAMTLRHSLQGRGVGMPMFNLFEERLELRYKDQR